MQSKPVRLCRKGLKRSKKQQKKFPHGFITYKARHANVARNICLCHKKAFFITEDFLSTEFYDGSRSL